MEANPHDEHWDFVSLTEKGNDKKDHLLPFLYVLKRVESSSMSNPTSMSNVVGQTSNPVANSAVRRISTFSWRTKQDVVQGAQRELDNSGLETIKRTAHVTCCMNSLRPSFELRPRTLLRWFGSNVPGSSVRPRPGYWPYYWQGSLPSLTNDRG